MSTNSILAAYKMKMKEDTLSLTNRRASKRLERKYRRDEEINKRRVLSNDMEEEHEPETESECATNLKKKVKAVKNTKCDDRIERLKKWKDEKKKKAQEGNAKPVFKTGPIQRNTEATLFQNEIQQLYSAPKVSKSSAVITKPVASMIKEVFNANKKFKSERLQVGKIAFKAVPVSHIKQSSGQKLVKSKISISGLKKETNTSVKAPETKSSSSLNKPESSKTVDKPQRKTRQFTDLSKKLTIAATSKMNALETSPKKFLRRTKSAFVKVAHPKKDDKKTKKNVNDVVQAAHQHSCHEIDERNLNQGSSDSQEGEQLSDANVPSPKHSTPHPLKFLNKRKSASSHKSRNDDLKGGRRESKRKSLKYLSPFPAHIKVIENSSDSEIEAFGKCVNKSDERQNPSAEMLINDSSNEDIKTVAFEKTRRSTRKSTHLTAMVQTEDQTASDMETTQSSIECIDQIAKIDTLHQTPPYKLQRSTRKSTRLGVMVPMEDLAHSDIGKPHSTSESVYQVPTSTVDLDLENQTPSSKHQNSNSKQRLQRSTRKSTRFPTLEDQSSSNNEKSQSVIEIESNDQILASTVNELDVKNQTPSSKSQSSSSKPIQRSTRKSTRLTNVVTMEQLSSTESVDQALISTVDKFGFEKQTPSKIGNNSSRKNIQRSTRKSSVDWEKTQEMKNTPRSTKRRRVSSRMAESPMDSSIHPENNATVDEFKVSQFTSIESADCLKEPLQIIQMSTFSEPEIDALKDDSITLRKKQSCTPSSLMKSFSELKCEEVLVAPVAMDVDADITPLSGQRHRMQSKMAKKKSVTPTSSKSASTNRIRDATRSAAKLSRSDRRSTARGRRSRSTAATLSVDEQATSGIGETGIICHSSSVPQRISRKSTVISVSDEGTAVGRNLELAVSYNVERQPVSEKASRILKELVVEKVDGDSSFFEISLDESFKSPKSCASNTPVLSVGRDENKQQQAHITPSNLSLMTTPKSHKRTRSMALSSAFKEPGLPLSAMRLQSASSRRRKTEYGTPKSVRSPEEMIDILKKSPMIEMTRRKSRHYSTPVTSTLNSTSDFSVLNAHDNGINHSDPLPAGNETCASIDVSSVEKTGTRDTSQEQLFRDLITHESACLNTFCSKWNQIVTDTTDLSEDVLGQIRSAIGKAQLLIAQRFKQFSGLIDNYAYGLGEKETTPTDLQGFWDMIYFQVENVNSIFCELDQLQAAGWQIKYPTPKAVVPKKRPISKGVYKKTIKSNFASFRNDLMKRKATSSNPENVVDIIM